MPIIEIKNFAQGINTQSDSEDSGKFTLFQNWEIDKPGLIYKRDFTATASTVLSMNADRGYRWMDINDAGDDYWVFVGENNSTPYIYYGTSLSGYLTTDTAATADTQIIPFNNRVRFANGRDTKPRLYQYIEREFFFGNYQPTDAINISNSEIAYPSTWDYQSIAEFGSGANAIGHYYYKFVPIFDGQQEAILEDAHLYSNLTSADKAIKLHLQLDTGNFNKRITAIKVYRSYNELNVEPSYYHIKTIPVNTDSSHDDISSLSGNIGYVLYAPAVDFTSYGTTYNELVINGTTYTIAASGKYDGYAILDSLIGSSDSLWGGSFTIQEEDEGTGYYNLTGGYAGRNVFFKSGASFDINQYDGWVVSDSSYDAVCDLTVAKAIKLNKDFGTTGTSVSLTINDGYRFSYSSPTVDLYFYDFGLLDGSPHPLGGKDKIAVNYGCGDYLNGRFFVGNVKLDPDGEAEVHRDWIIYSEFLQPDVLPIANYIQIKDAQGGEIKAIKAYSGDLVVFGERGIFRLQVPSLDPSGWQLTESEKNVNIVSPDSIVEVEGMMFFAAKDNVYVITPQFQVYPVANDIKNDYQAIGDLESSSFVYDVKKQRLLCSFGQSDTIIYALDLRAFMTNGATVWTKIVLTGQQADLLIKDENNIIYSGYHSGTSMDFHQLYGGSGGETYATPVLKTGHMRLSDMKKDVMIRRMNISYKSEDNIAVYFYLDKSTSAASFYNQSASGQNYIQFDSSSSYTNKSIRIGRRASFMQVVIQTVAATGSTVEISKIEFEIDV